MFVAQLRIRPYIRGYLMIMTGWLNDGKTIDSLMLKEMTMDAETQLGYCDKCMEIRNVQEAKKEIPEATK